MGISQEFYQTLTKEEKDTLISLLSEYSDKLLNICDKIEELQRKIFFYDLVFKDSRFKNRHFASVVIIMIIALTNCIATIQILNNLRTLEKVTFEFYIVLELCLIIVSILYMRDINLDQRIKLLQREGARIKSRLEKVIRFTSQLEDKFINNKIQLLELDIRLADAESALTYYETIVEGKKLL